MSPQSPWQAMLMICERDLLLAYRRWDRVLQPVAFLVMVATLFPLALEPDQVFLRTVAPGLLWIAALLASLLALDFVFRADYEDGALEQLHLSGQPLTLLVVAKSLAHWVISGLPLVVVGPLVALALAVPLAALPAVAASLALGTLVLSFLGAVGAALTLSVRRGGVLLSVLVLPLSMPSLIFGARAIDMAVQGDGAAGPLYLLAAIAMGSVTLAPFATAVALRIATE